MADNLSAVLVAKGDLQLKQMPFPSAPQEGEVLLKTLSVGICGSDVHYWTHGGIGAFRMTGPMVLGHETCAEVIQLGPGVTNVKVGDKVAIEPGLMCQSCNFCKEGNYNLCPKMVFHATPPFDGTLTRVFKHRGDLCFKILDTMTPDEGACIEPLSVGVYSCVRSGLKVGQRVLINGAGPIGLVSLMSARAFGASEISITDMNPARLAAAKQIDPKVTTILLAPKDGVAENKKKVLDSFKGQEPHVTLDCCGFESSVELAIEVTQPGGVIVLTGMGQDVMKVPLILATTKEVDIRGVFRYKNTWPLCLQLIGEGKIDVSKLITHRFTLEQTMEAFDTAKSGVGIKVIIDCSGKK